MEEALEWEGSAGALDSQTVPAGETAVNEASNEVASIDFKEFRSALVTHFDWALKKNEITWLKRQGP